MTKASDNLFPGIIIRESADDGSDFSNPSADYRRFFVGEDGDLHLKDSSGTVTDFPAGGGGGGGGITEFAGVKLTGGGGDITTSSTTFVDLTGATVTLTTAAVRCFVMFSANVVNSNAGNSAFFDVAIDGTRYANTTNGISQTPGGTANWHVSFSFMTDVLSAASHTIKVQWRVSANTGGVDNQTTTSPIIFQVVETGLTT